MIQNVDRRPLVDEVQKVLFMFVVVFVFVRICKFAFVIREKEITQLASTEFKIEFSASFSR